MGLFDDFDVDMDEIKAAGTFEIADGNYDFEISEMLRQNGSKNNPDNTYYIIKFDLDENGTYQEWFTVAEDGDTETAAAQRGLSYLKSRLIDLGIPASEHNTVEPEELEGIRGTLQLVTTNGKGKNADKKYQNVRNVKVDAEEEEPELTAAQQKAADLAAKKRVAAAKAARTKEAPAADAPVRRTRAAKPVEEPEDEDAVNPFETE